jgi:Cu/Ag efflux protein CusF
MTRVRWALPATLLVAAATLLVAAGAAAQPTGGTAPRPDYRGTGVVLAVLPPPSSLHATRPVIIIDHQPIAGLMDEAMSMPFIAASTDLFHGLRPGDHIAFGIKDTPGALLVISVDRVGPKP